MKNNFKEIFSSEDLTQCWLAIQSANSFALLGHRDPDRDTVFSCLAMAKLLHLLGKGNTQIIFPNKPVFRFHSPHAKVLIGKHELIPDMVLVFDASVKERVYFPAVFERGIVVNIDHHLGNTIRGSFNFVDINACSAAEVLARLVVAWNLNLLVPQLSQLLLIGILDDSITFRTSQTGQSALATALTLIEHGADFARAKKLVAGYKTPEMVKAWSSLIASGTIYAGGRLFVIAIDQKGLKDRKIKVNELEGLINFVAGVIRTDIVALVRETIPGAVKVSLRSKQSDVQVIANNFGGGGHKHAAGFTLQANVGEVTARLVEDISSFS
jgi:phosphoesterase RecJ-like protein